MPDDSAAAVAARPEGHTATLLRAAGWMGLSLLSFTLLAVAARQLLDTMGPVQILLLRSAIGLALIVAFGLVRARGFQRTRQMPLHLLRNLFHYGAQVCWVAALGLLPLATLFALEFTTPIWAALLVALFLGERLDRPRLVAIGLGFVGILVILRPGWAPLGPGVLLATAAAMGFAVNLTATKALLRHDRPITILFYMLLIQLVLGALPAAFLWQPLAWGDLIWLTLVAVTGLSAHYGIQRAFQLADATVVLPMDFLRLPLIALVGFLLYGEALDLAVILGAALIVGGNYHSLSHERRRRG